MNKKKFHNLLIVSICLFPLIFIISSNAYPEDGDTHTNPECHGEVSDITFISKETDKGFEYLMFSIIIVIINSIIFIIFVRKKFEK